eukprot:COSAG01_NODE_3045_length_6671_cov_14.931396_6_plen_51_part_00
MEFHRRVKQSEPAARSATRRNIVMTGTESLTEIPLRFYSLSLLVLHGCLA